MRFACVILRLYVAHTFLGEMHMETATERAFLNWLLLSFLAVASLLESCELGRSMHVDKYGVISDGPGADSADKKCEWLISSKLPILNCTVTVVKRRLGKQIFIYIMVMLLIGSYVSVIEYLMFLRNSMIEILGNGTSVITLTVHEFATECLFHFLYIYDGSLPSTRIELAALSGNLDSEITVTATSGQVGNLELSKAAKNPNRPNIGYSFNVQFSDASGSVRS